MIQFIGTTQPGNQKPYFGTYGIQQLTGTKVGAIKTDQPGHGLSLCIGRLFCGFRLNCGIISKFPYHDGQYSNLLFRRWHCMLPGSIGLIDRFFL